MIVLLVGPYAGWIPMAVIGGIMLVIGAELLEKRVPDIRLVLHTSWPSAIAMVITFLATTAMPLQYAIFLGAGLSILLTSISVTRSSRLMEFTRTDGAWQIGDPPARLASGRTTVLHYEGSGFFSEVSRIDQEWPDTDGVTDAAIVLSVRGSVDVPSATFLKALDDRVGKLGEQGIPVFLAGVPPRFREQLIRSRELKHLVPDHLVAETPRLTESLEQAYDRAEHARLNSRTGTATEGPAESAHR
ncbi:hypothetical protein ACFQO7_35525 [Catellatospora aurea]|uniref:STAS domain-containing protein n=1 Tax=Catellatospora aurea TaxID=1337874 RepID=A0ABW2H783_9ACTN